MGGRREQAWRGIRDPPHTCSKPGGSACGLSPGTALHREPGRCWGGHPPATPGAGLFFPRSPSWRKQRPTGSCKPPPSLWLSSCGMRWLPPRCSPEAPEAGRWLCEKHPGLWGGDWGFPHPSEHPQDPLLRPLSPGSASGAGRGYQSTSRGQTCTLSCFFLNY